MCEFKFSFFFSTILVFNKNLKQTQKNPFPTYFIVFQTSFVISFPPSGWFDIISYSDDLDYYCIWPSMLLLCRRDVLMHCSLRCKINCGWKMKSWSSSRPSWQKARLQSVPTLHHVSRSLGLSRSFSLGLSDPPKRIACRQRDRFHPHLFPYVLMVFLKDMTMELCSAHSKLNSNVLYSSSTNITQLNSILIKCTNI